MTSSSRASDNHVVAAVSRDIREVIGTLWGFSAMDAAAAAHVAEQHQLIAEAVAAPRCVCGRRGHARASPVGSAGGSARARRTVRAPSLLRDEDRLDMGLVIGIDTGGTFTDMVVLDPATGRIDSLKTSSMPSTPGQAIVNALDEGGVAAGEIERFTHGTTVGTNALIERTGCRVAFVTTKGFEDTPFIQRINRKVLYDLRWSKPEPLVASRRLCLGLDERLDASGAEIRPVDEAEVRRPLPDDPRVRCGGSRDLPPVLVREHRSRGAGQADPRRGAAGPADLRFPRGRADLAGVRALLDDDRRRLPPSAARHLRREPRRCAARRGNDARVDADEVERRGDAVRCGRGRADPDGDVRPGGRHDRYRARGAGPRGGQRAHPRHGRHERRRGDPRRRQATSHDRVRDRVGAPRGGAADRHQVGRGGRRLDRLGGCGWLPARRAEERRGRSQARSVTGAAARRSRSPTRTSCSAGSTRSTSSPGG